MLGFNLLAALMALFMLWRHGRPALALLRGDRSGPGRARAILSLLNCLVALAVLALAAHGAYLTLTRTPGGTP